MSDVTIESLQLEINSNSQNATTGIDALSSSLSNLKNSIKGGVGLNAVANQINKLNSSLTGMNSNAPFQINRLANSLQKLSNLGQLKLSSSIGNQLKNIGQATNSLNGVNFSSISRLGTALAPLSNIQKSSGLNSTIKELEKLPALAQTLNGVNWSAFASQIRQLSNALVPLSSQLSKISTSFTSLPKKVNQMTNATNRLAQANNRGTSSYVNFWAKARMFSNVVRIGVGYITDWITSSNKYIEDMNLFSVSMGEYAQEAFNYANQVSEIMGIDPAEWLRNQGIFNTIIKGFGVANDQAALMSKNLTQLGYDISSFYNISYEEAFTKLQSGISGELEPLRRLGYDLSVARLQQEALNLGITKSVSAMTQAEKSQLRYYAIMTQVKDVQGDMARTLTAPANQLRVLKAQIDLTARAFGNLFIPILNATLPYIIAIAKALRLVAEAIASFFGIDLPSVDFSGVSAGAGAVGELADNADDATSGLGGASKAAEKLKNNLLGIDELNIISPEYDNASSGAGGGGGVGGGAGGGGDLGIDLPEYDFLGDAVASKVDEILAKIKDNMQAILTIAGSVAGAIAGWKLAKFLQDIGLLKGGLRQALGIALAMGGAVAYISGGIDAWNNGLDLTNFIEMLAGATAVVVGIGLAFGAIPAFIAGVIVSLGILVVSIKDIIDNGINMINFIGTLVGMAGTTIFAALISPIAGAVAAVIAGIAGFFAGIWDAIENGINWLNGILITAGATLAGAGVGAMIGMVVGSIGGPLGAAIGAAIGALVGLLTDAVIYTVQHWEEIVDYYENMWLEAEDEWNSYVVPFFEGIPDWIAGVLNDVKGWFIDRWNDITNFMSGIPDKIANVVNSVGQWFFEMGQKIAYELGFALGKLVKWISDMVKEAKEKIPKLINDIKQWFSELPDKIWNAIISAVDKIKEWANRIWNFLSVKVPETIESVRQWFSELPDKIWNAVISAVDKITEWANNIWNFLSQKIPEIVESVFQWFTALPNRIWDAISGAFYTVISWVGSMIDTVRGWVPSIIDNFVSFFAELPSRLWNLGTDIINGLIEGVKNAWNSLKSGIKGICDSFMAGFKDGLGIHSPSTVARDEIGVFIGEGILQGLMLPFDKIETWINDNIVKPIVNILDNGILAKGIDVKVNLVKNRWTTLREWIGNIPTLNQPIALVKKGWTTVKNWIGDIPTLYQKIALAKDGWNTVKSWVEQSLGGTVTMKVRLEQESSGSSASAMAMGGFINSQGLHAWNVPTYAGGSILRHGSMFIAGENGAELVGHLNGQTEVLNQSQIKLAMRSAVVSGMASISPILTAINSNVVNSSNAIANSVLTGSQAVYNGIQTIDTYDPTSSLSSTAYEEAVSAYRRSVNDETMYSSMRDFYHDFVEPTLMDIASDTKRQADKEENIKVQVGNRDITRSVDIQKQANGYSFT